MEITVEYEGGLRCKAVHESSGVAVITDGPIDNHGLGENFSPSDLLGVALGSCILSMMGMAARPYGVDISGAKVSVIKTMGNAPRRITRIDANVEMQALFDEQIIAALEAAAHSCPVHSALSTDVIATIQISWPKP